MTLIQKQITVNAPSNQVWSVLADLGGIYRYSPGVKHSYYNTSSTKGEGSGRICELLPMGEVEEKAVNWEEGKTYTLQISPIKNVPPISNTFATITINEAGLKTQVLFRMEYSLKYGPIGALMNSLMVKSSFDKSIEGVLKGLKHFVETGEEVKPSVLKKTNYQLVTS